jgi:hypothetical protein
MLLCFAALYFFEISPRDAAIRAHSTLLMLSGHG